MQVIQRLQGIGTLYADDHPPTKAEYFLTVCRLIKGPDAGEIVVSGQIEASLNVMLSAEEGRASLTLQDGSTHEVVLRSLTGTGSEVRFLKPTSSLIP